MATLSSAGHRTLEHCPIYLVAIHSFNAALYIPSFAKNFLRALGAPVCMAENVQGGGDGDQICGDSVPYFMPV